MRVRYKFFESGVRSWDDLFGEAATFATEIGPERLIGISVVEGRTGVVTVWYWEADGIPV